jgi:hypothetical protein
MKLSNIRYYNKPKAKVLYGETIYLGSLECLDFYFFTKRLDMIFIVFGNGNISSKGMFRNINEKNDGYEFDLAVEKYKKVSILL